MTWLRMMVLMLLAAGGLVLAGCAPVETAVGECEPGVAEISDMAAVVPSEC